MMINRLATLRDNGPLTTYRDEAVHWAESEGKQLLSSCGRASLSLEVDSRGNFDGHQHNWSRSGRTITHGSPSVRWVFNRQIMGLWGMPGWVNVSYQENGALAITPLSTVC
ncbi:hypothetical protein LU631_15990 [Erwinia tracheiphila]|uniref:Uncharacterized protein n=1 Tax=Erwinia tracheiphila TaxID=65700 RepID=A0A345CRD4_9GAMM|nr:hypothetical protein [Erwinia tracheiphila]AXF76001.1 hypothetical protein AV903_07990 [Erwinia tracheiphila]UIA85866.1 hypothetical protein LU604_11250 [Erwinia tracheiphila]UIA90224.1 hypothetical protein LU631_15990 [Erwinia tracheiphila]UIA94387.1 hypothetical protein LU632_10815 [Erwinia tracheiphila]UIA98756.1 hypothetical protein LU633_14450 [Erwinia tracheiphila]